MYSIDVKKNKGLCKFYIVLDGALCAGYVVFMELDLLQMTPDDKFRATNTLQVYLRMATAACAMNERCLMETNDKLRACKKKEKKRLKKAQKNFKERVEFWQSKRVLYKSQLRDLESV